MYHLFSPRLLVTLLVTVLVTNGVKNDYFTHFSPSATKTDLFA